MPEPSAVHIDSTLTKMSVQYRNEEYIWREVMPIVDVNKRSDKYYIYDKDQRFREPNDQVNAKGMPNEVELVLSNDNYSVQDHALGGWVSQEEMDNADSPLQPLMDENDLINELLELKQEIRVASIVFTAANYPTGNKVQLSGTGQWGGSADDPIGDIMTALNAPFKRPNVLTFGNDAWLKFRQLPEIIDAVKSATRQQGAAGGIAKHTEIAELFSVDKVLVGHARKNTTKEGQAASYSRIWGKHMAALYVNPSQTIKSVTFGKTFSETQKRTFRDFDGKRGVKGAHYVKTGWNSDEKIVAADCGYLIEDAVA